MTSHIPVIDLTEDSHGTIVVAAPVVTTSTAASVLGVDTPNLTTVPIRADDILDSIRSYATSGALMFK